MTGSASLSAFICVNQPPDAVLALPQSAAGWDRLIRQASSHALLPTLASRARTLDITAALPPDILHLCEFTEECNAERNRVILGEAVHVANLLNQIGIQPVALKGLAYLLTGVYSDPAQRYLLDIDLLLPSAEIPHAIAHLKHHGYLEHEGGRFMQFRHHFPSIRRHSGPPIEIHHRVGQGICDRLLPASEILAHATPLTYQGATFLIPSPTCLANHLILHSQLAHPYHNRIFAPLRALFDLTRLQSRFPHEINWTEIAKTYRDNGESATLALHLRYANHVLGANFPVETSGFYHNLRWQRRLLLHRYPTLRYIDPIYWPMSLFSRRIRLLPEILATPSSWPQVLRELLRPDFYKNLFAL